MKALMAIVSIIFLGAASSASALDHKRSSPAPAAPYEPGQILVKFKERTLATAMAEAHSQVGGREIRHYANFERLKLVEVPAGMSVEDGLQRYRKLPGVESAGPNYIRQIGGAPNDPYFANGKLWGLQNTGTPGADIHATAAWDLSTGSRDVVVMVIDSGIDYNHRDLADNMWRNTADCYNDGIDHDGNGYINDCYGINPAYDNSNPWDDNGHGSHVAGIIGAVGNNNLGVVGVNWQVSLMACKASGWQGLVSDANAIKCLDYALTMKQRGVNIFATNNSYGNQGGFDSYLRDAILAHAQQGILFIAQASTVTGNEDEDRHVYYPANYDLPNVIAVAATGQQDQLYPASGFGDHTVHLGAPGDFIYSTVTNNGYDLYSGTSMAAAFVTGVAALLKAQDPSRDWRAIKNLILTGGDQNQALSNPFSKTITGKRLNAYGSMTCSNSTLLARFRPKSRLGLLEEPILMGSTVGLSVLNINCAAPNGPVSVTVQPGNIVIPLVDDGTGSDVAAGDGLYSATWIPPSEGAYTLSFPDNSTWQASVVTAYRNEVVDFNWRTIDGTNLNLSDDSSATIRPPFPVNLGRISYSRVYVDSNGKLNFDYPYVDYQNRSLVDNNAQQYFHLVAGFWDDLLPIQNTAQNVFWAVTGAAPQRELVIEWRDVSRASGCNDPTAKINFQIVLFEGSSDVLVNYGHTSFGGPPECAVGDMGAHATAGILLVSPAASQYSYDQPNLTDNLALKYSFVH